MIPIGFGLHGQRSGGSSGHLESNGQEISTLAQTLVGFCPSICSLMPPVENVVKLAVKRPNTMVINGSVTPEAMEQKKAIA